MFPRTAPYETGRLDVGGGHRIHWEQTGNPHGIPAVHLHGGPGGGLGRGGYRMSFDPDRFRLVGLDQRGCGRSIPLVTEPGYDLDANTTPSLIADIEQLRRHLGIERWLVSGVSWGSTLALAYALAHPDRVSGIVLMAVTTTARSEVEWITETVGAIYPEAWDRLASHAERADPSYRRRVGRVVESYARLMRDPDPDVRDAASLAWRDWEDHHVAIGAGGVHHDVEDDGGLRRRVFSTLVTHYWSHDGFVNPPIMQRVAELHDIPATLIHGRLDVSGPAVVAWDLHRAWPGSELVVVEDEGHGGPAMAKEWADATSRHADRLTSC